MNKLGKPLSFIVLSNEAWTNPRRARKQLMFEALLRQPLVSELLYIDPPAHFGRSNTYRTKENPMIRICERAYILKGERFAPVRWINRFLVYQSLKKFIKPDIRWFTFLYNPWDLYLANFFSRHGPVIFDWTEDWSVYYDSVILGVQQRKAINRSSGIITVTESLADQAKEIAMLKKNILFLPNATAWKPMDNLRCPDEMKHISPPRIGYSGSLGPWFNKKLVLDLAKSRPEWKWIIIGHANRKTRDHFSNVKNVYFFGLKPFESIQSYLAQCHVLVAPYTENINGDSSKLYDYLTLGQPIVSSGIETASRLKEHVCVATGTHQWIQAIEKALKEPNTGQRKVRQEASSYHTWDTRASALLDWLTQF